MLFQLFFIILFNGLGEILACDPFFGPQIMFNCFRERKVSGCNESIADVYDKTQCGKVDPPTNEPDTWMYLFTQRNRDNPEPLHKCGGKLPKDTNYKASSRTIIYIHGHMICQCHIATMREMKDQALYRGDYNVILIDWCWGNQQDYNSSVINTRTVATQIAFLIRNIMHQTNTGPEKFHLVGVSLGAQISGFVGECFKPNKIRRITGMDPAYPGFEVEDRKQRLDRSDAEFVDVIHTNAGTSSPNLGDPRPCGHADFYVNGGTIQLSCLSNLVDSLLKGDLVYAFLSVMLNLCSHAQSMQYYKVSINPCDCQFVGVECKSYEDFQSGQCRDCGEDGSKCAVMGMDWELFPKTKENQTYYFNTGFFCPYCDNSGINLNGFTKLIEKYASERHCFHPGSKV